MYIVRTGPYVHFTYIQCMFNVRTGMYGHKLNTVNNKNDSKYSELGRNLIGRAQMILEERKDLQKPKSRQEIKVEKFPTYMNIALQKINSKLWIDFTVDSQRLAHNYAMKVETLESIEKEKEQLSERKSPQYPQPGISTRYLLMAFSAPSSNLTYTLLHVPTPHYSKGHPSACHYGTSSVVNPREG